MNRSIWMDFTLFCNTFEYADVHTLFLVSLTFILSSFGVLYLSEHLSQYISVSHTFFQFLQTFPEYLRLQKASSVHDRKSFFSAFFTPPSRPFWDPHQLQLFNQQPLSIMLQHKAFMDREAFHLRRDFPDDLRLLIQQFLGKFFWGKSIILLCCRLEKTMHF